MSHTEDNQIFLNAIRALNVTSRQAMALSLELAPQNPCEFLELTKVGSERRFSFARLFDQLLVRGHINWSSLRQSLADLALELHAQELDRETAADHVAPLPSLKTFAIAYCGEFKHKHLWDKLLPALGAAHRSPTLFASRLIEIGASLREISADEWLNVSPKSLRAMNDVSILYLCTHGRVEKAHYQAAMYDHYWQPSASDFCVKGPKVLALDTCHGADRTPPYQNFWSVALKGASIRLLLACEGPIVMDRLSAKRGYAFGDNLSQGNTSIADAWLRAVRATSTTGTSRPVAIGLGDNTSDAEAMLRLTFDDLSSPQKRPAPLSPCGSVCFADRH
jgi:hypothetical protein